MLNVARFIFNPFKENTYVVWDETLEGILVDPGNNYQKETDSLVKFINAKGIRPLALVSTHGHYDHVCGAGFLQGVYDVPFALSSVDEYVYCTSAFDGDRYQFKFKQVPYAIDLADGAPLCFGNTSIRPIATPGHTRGGVSLYCQDAKIIFTGDTLMCGTIGRTDLKGSDYPTIMDSITNRLLPLPDDVMVYPGHGPHTTIGAERSGNPFLI